jgi:hypothetical protein
MVLRSAAERERLGMRPVVPGREPAQPAETPAAAADLVAETAQNGGQGTAGQSPDGSG